MDAPMQPLAGAVETRPALSGDPLTAESLAGSLVRGAALGDGGGVGGIITRAGQAAGDRVSAVMDAAAAPPLDARAALAQERDAERAQAQATADAAKPQLLDELRALRADQRPLREALAPSFSSASPEAKAELVRSERSMGGLIGSNAMKVLANPARALQAVQAYEKALTAAAGADPPRLAVGMLERVADLRSRLEAISAPTSPRLLELEGQLAKEPAAVAPAGTTDAPAAEGAGPGMMSWLLAGDVAGGMGPRISEAVKTRATELGARISAVAQALTGGERTASSRAPLLGSKDFEKVRDWAFSVAADPQGAAQKMSDQLDGIRATGDHDLVAQVLDRMTAIGQHLAQVAPKSLAPLTLLGGMDAPVGAMDKVKFLDRAAVAFHPEVLLDRIEDGMLTPGLVETAEAVAPQAVSALRQRVAQRLNGADVAPNRRLVLSMLMGGPADPSLTPEHIAASQARMANEVAQVSQPPQPPATSAASAKTIDERTTAQQLAGR